MIVYGLLRRWLKKDVAWGAAVLIYAALMLLVFLSYSQFGVDMRYAKL